MGSLTHQTVNYVKGAGAGIEKRVLDKIKALEKYVHCCVNKSETLLLTSNVADTGNWNTIAGSGIEIIPAPGAGYVNVIHQVVSVFNGADVGGGGNLGEFSFFQSSAPLTNTMIPVPALAGASVDLIGQRVGLGVDPTSPNTEYVPGAATFLNVTTGAANNIAATCLVTIYYQTVAIK